LLPKEMAMAQLSRPYQIALVAMAFLALVWFVALRGHSASSSSTPVASAPVSTTPSTAESSAASEAKAAAAPTPVYHGAAPGVEGLTRAINRAHGAVATSQQNAKQLQEKSAQASSPTSTGGPSSASTTGSQSTSSASVTSKSSATTSKGAARTAPKPHKVTSHGIPPPPPPPAQQVAVESELKHGKVVLLLFWNPKGADDVAVRKELQAVGKSLGGKIAVHDALANQVGLFGSITQAIQVYQTPTILLVNKHGLTTTLTGFTDAFSIEQTVTEARHA
jgi:hypothetical protein